MKGTECQIDYNVNTNTCENSSPFPALENNCEAWHFGIVRIVVNAYLPFDDVILVPLCYEKCFHGYEIDATQLEDK
jgi:hypothetical protein